ncbi:MAG: hypothetical protein PHR43_02975 [Dehalococcoidales bacterium]|nr:hypothetical protein [Dehalococcoidales bacterium]
MKLFKLALEKQRWDFVAHTIIYATANFLNKGGDTGVGRKRKGNKRTGQPKR